MRGKCHFRFRNLLSQHLWILLDTVPPLFVVGGIERVLAFTIQIGLSLVVLYAIRSRRSRFLLLAIATHTLIDFGAVLLAGNIIVAEVCVAACAVASLMWIIKSKRLFIEKEPLESEQS